MPSATLVERAAILPRDEPEAVTILRDALIREGITLHECIEVAAARDTAAGVELEWRGNAGTVLVQGLTPETLGALIGLAVLSLAAIPLKARFAKS
jgi:sulfur relay (sulfurtransferase) complex TusBCD TusD component (DsrE family)